MNVLLFCLQEHGDDGESSERNDVGSLSEKSQLGVQGVEDGSVKDTVGFSQSAFANINEVSECDPKSVSTTKY